MYFPILRWKAGEQKCVTNLDDSISKFMVPIWWLHNEQEISEIIANSKEIWHQYSLIDLSRCGKLSSTAQELTAIKNRHFGIVLNVEQISAYGKKLITDLGEHLVIRIGLNNRQIPNDKLDDFTRELMGLGITPNLLIMIDLATVTSNISVRVNEIANLINHLAFTGFKHMVLSSGAFPESLSNIQGLAYLERHDRSFYIQVCQKLKTKIHYSDYGVVSPDWKPQTGGGAPLANIRYTSGDRWLIIRDNDKGKEASIAVAEILVNGVDYKKYGEGFSWSDRRWWEKAEKHTNPGGPTEHIAEAQNHHISHVCFREI